MNGRTIRNFMKMWPQIRWSLLAIVAATVTGQSQMVIVTLLAGPAAFAPLAAGFVLMSPTRILVFAISAVMRPDLSRSNARGEHRSAGSLLFRTSSALALASIGYGLCLFLAWPVLDPLLFERKFSDQPMGLIVALAWLATTLSCGTSLMQTSMQAKSKFRDGALPAIGGTLIALILVPALLLAFEPALSTLGVVVAEIVTVTILGLSHARDLRAAGRASKTEMTRRARTQDNSIELVRPI